ncbi:unnamed protein product [Symbiodinium sp. KB8]|nr:unnamed protein product [Symbiodinium sp. KB8]
MPLPEDCFENLIFHAFGRDPGMTMGSYGFINRHDDRLWPEVDDVIEDAERSARYYHVDGVVLRYRFLCGVTRCFKERGGLQAEFEGSTLKALNQDEGGDQGGGIGDASGPVVRLNLHVMNARAKMQYKFAVSQWCQ